MDGCEEAFRCQERRIRFRASSGEPRSAADDDGQVRVKETWFGQGIEQIMKNGTLSSQEKEPTVADSDGAGDEIEDEDSTAAYCRSVDKVCPGVTVGCVLCNVMPSVGSACSPACRVGQVFCTASTVRCWMQKK